MNWTTFCAISHPVGSCQVKRPIPSRLKAMWALRALSFPFAISGTSDAAMAQQTTTPAPEKRGTAIRILDVPHLGIYLGIRVYTLRQRVYSLYPRYTVLYSGMYT